jgi:O-methyltransferase involved in polyketide biosynthesis
MSLVQFTRKELASALARGVRQCVIIGRPALREALADSAGSGLRVISVEELAAETLATELEQSGFDKLKAGLFVWLGGTGYRTVDAVIGSLAFIASLPKGSGVVLDYVEERASFGDRALDALASRLGTAGGSVKYLIQPQAVRALLRGVGFREIVDLAGGEATAGRLVSALV